MAFFLYYLVLLSHWEVFGLLFLLHRILLFYNFGEEGKNMMCKIKQFQNNKLFCTIINLFSILFPSANVLFFKFDLQFIPIYNLLFIGFYSILGNAFLFRNNKILRTLLIAINLIFLLIWYFVSTMGYWRGIFFSVCYSVIPFFAILLKIFRLG